MSKLFDARDGDYIQLPWARGGNGCKISWKDSSGDERVLLQLRQNPQQDGEYYLAALDQSKYQELLAKGDPNALDHAMIEVATTPFDKSDAKPLWSAWTGKL